MFSEMKNNKEEHSQKKAVPVGYFEAVQSGEIDLETLKATLTEAMPDQAEEIMGYLEMMMQLYGGSEGAVAGD